MEEAMDNEEYDELKQLRETFLEKMKIVTPITHERMENIHHLIKVKNKIRKDTLKTPTKYTLFYKHKAYKDIETGIHFENQHS